MQHSDTVLMIRPASFRRNEETAGDNRFQGAEELEPGEANRRAREEFDAFVGVLRGAGVRVIVVDDEPVPETPDALFPNNWISMHHDGRVVLWPMYPVNRRTERRLDVLDRLRAEGFSVGEVVDWSGAEERGVVVEGTGSLVLDHDAKIAYAARSQRTHPELVDEFCRSFGYESVLFEAEYGGAAVYHTNVLLCVADRYALLCSECIPDAAERAAVERSIVDSGKELIRISAAQMAELAGNMLQVKSTEGQTRLVMSSRAYRSLTAEQRSRLEALDTLVHSELGVIENLGGGSARCMLAEVFLPPAKTERGSN